MKKISALALSVSLASFSAAVAGAQDTPTVMDLTPIGQSTGATRFAPADVTFGHYHLSIMGIGNEIALAGKRFGDESEREELETGAFMYVVDAMRDWERKFRTIRASRAICSRSCTFTIACTIPRHEI